MLSASASFAGPISFLKRPTADPDPETEIAAGKTITFKTTVRFAPPGGEDEEPWVGVQYNFGDGTPIVSTGQHFGAGPQAVTTTHVFQNGGEYEVTCVAYHGFKLFGFKYASTAKFKVVVLPSLPLTIGVMTINGDTLTSVGEPADRVYKVSGNVTINNVVAVNNDVTVDFPKNEVTLAGELQVPAAGRYSEILKTSKNLTFDALTGSPSSSELAGVEAKFEISKFKIEFTNFKIAGAGLEFDFKFQAPRLVEGDANGKDLIKLEFKKFRVDAVAPYLHTLGDTTLTVSNLKIAGTDYGLDELSLTFNFGPPSKYAGTVKIALPSDRSLAGDIEFLDGQLSRLGFTAGLKIPIFTISGVGDAIYLTSINANVRGLAVVEGQPPQDVVIAAGELDPGTLDVTTPGITLEWGAGSAIVGLEATPITVDGAAEFSSAWDLTLGGELTFFKDKFGTRFRMAQVRGSYRHDASTIVLTGKLSYDDLFSLQGTVSSRFSEFDYYHAAVATGSVTLPPGHWARKFISNGTGTAILILRASPTEKYLAGFRGTGTLPVLGEKTVSFQIDLATGDLSSDLDSDIVALLPSKAVATSATLTNGQGADGLVVRLLHSSGTGDFNLRLPNGTLLTPASANGTTIAYANGAPESVYLLADAPDGTYTAEFDDAGLGTVSVRYIIPRASPGVTVSAPAAALSISRYGAVPVTFDAAGLPSDTPVRAYLDADGEMGGGHLVAEAASLATTSLTGDVRNVPPGTYRVVLEADPVGGLPVSAAGSAIVTVREYASIDLVVTKGQLLDDARAGRDRFVASGTISINADSPDQSFDPATDALTLRLGDAASPLVVSVPAGDAAWKVKGTTHSWKGKLGAKGKIALSFDVAKRKFSVSVTNADLPAAPANPVALAMVFGDDEGSVTSEWTVRKPGLFSKP